MKTFLIMCATSLVLGCGQTSNSANGAMPPHSPNSPDSPVTPQTDCAGCSADAVYVATQLAAQKFNCSFAPVSAQRGYRCRGTVAAYSQPVNIFLPPDLQRDRDITLAYHFHGWWPAGNSTPLDGADGDYGAFLAAANRNIVLIIPESRGNNENYAKEMATAQAVNAIFANIENKLANAGLSLTLNTPRLISGHSGAYVQLGKLGSWAQSGAVPFLKSLRGVGLLDTAYGYRAGLVAFNDVECANQSATYFLAFNPNDGSNDKKTTNQRIYSEVTTTHACAKAKVSYTPDPNTAHLQFPRKFLPQFFTMSVSPLTAKAL